MAEQIGLPTEIDGVSVDKLCEETAELFAKYGVDFMEDKKLKLELSDTIFDFLKKKCGISIAGDVPDYSESELH